MGNLVRSRNREPFDFQDGLKVAGVDIGNMLGGGGSVTNASILAALGYTPLNKAGDTMSGNLNVSGAITATGNVSAYSDERLKKDWDILAPNYVVRLANVKFGTYTNIYNNERMVGVSAQSLQELLPESIIIDPETELLSVAYGNAALVSSIELAKEVVHLKSEVRMLTECINALTERLNKLVD